MESPGFNETDRLDPDEATPGDDRATTPPAEGADPDPTPGEDAGPHGNPAQDEEGLSHQQQDSEPGQDAS
jgi:hypothetical protein